MNTPSLLLSLELFDSEKARKDGKNAETFVICDDNSYLQGECVFVWSWGVCSE